MPKLSAERKKSLLAAAHSYHKAMPGSPAEKFLESRGLLDAVPRFHLGYVDEPHRGHDKYVGRLAIPYASLVPGIAMVRSDHPISLCHERLRA